MKAQSIIVLAIFSASCSVAEPSPVEAQQTEKLIASSEVALVYSKASNIHYSVETRQEVKEDLERRLSIFPLCLNDSSQMSLWEGVEMSGADYLGYCLVDLEGESHGREVWIMVLSDEMPELHFRNDSDENTWGSPLYSRLNSTKDGHVFVFKMAADSKEGFVREPLRLLVSTSDGRNISIDA